MTNKKLIIAEIGWNWAGNSNLAKWLINSAKENGADIVKFQIFDTDSIFDKDFRWYQAMKQSQLDFDTLIELKEYCDSLNIEFLASVFDTERVKWTEKIDMKRYKIASRSVNDYNLINAIAKTEKDVIVSLGMWKEKDFPLLPIKGKCDFLYCISEYPALIDEIDFSGIDFESEYSGFSDHTIGIDASKIALSRGAKIIEKHFTLSKGMYGNDHLCSMEPNELKDLVDFAKLTEKVI